MPHHDETRPTVLDNASETQIDELERHFDEGDKKAWKTLIESYGWSDEDGTAVWEWFGQDPERGMKKSM